MPIVWQIAVLTLKEKTFIKGVILSKSPVAKSCRSGFFRHFIGVIKSYFIRVYAQHKIIIQISGKDYFTQTDSSGSFFLTIEKITENKIKIFDESKNRQFEIVQDYPVFFKNNEDSLGIISDIDDTIIVSYTANALKRIGTLIFIPPLKRKIVNFTDKIMSFLRQKPAEVYYVSKSENNLFAVITSVIKEHQLPQGILFLTPYLQFKALFHKKKGIDFKFSTIEFLILNTNHQKIILFGDDTQKDMEVYRLIAEKYPEKIAGIFIRQTKALISKRKKQYFDQLKQVFPRAVYFNQKTDFEKEIKTVF